MIVLNFTVVLHILCYLDIKSYNKSGLCNCSSLTCRPFVTAGQLLFKIISAYFEGFGELTVSIWFLTPIEFGYFSEVK